MISINKSKLTLILTLGLLSPFFTCFPPVYAALEGGTQSDEEGFEIPKRTVRRARPVDMEVLASSLPAGFTEEDRLFALQAFEMQKGGHAARREAEIARDGGPEGYEHELLVASLYSGMSRTPKQRRRKEKKLREALDMARAVQMTMDFFMEDPKTTVGFAPPPRGGAVAPPAALTVDGVDPQNAPSAVLLAATDETHEITVTDADRMGVKDPRNRVRGTGWDYLFHDKSGSVGLPNEIVDRVMAFAGLDAVARFALTTRGAYERYGFLCQFMVRDRPSATVPRTLLPYNHFLLMHVLDGAPFARLNLRGTWTNREALLAMLAQIQRRGVALNCRALDVSVLALTEPQLTKPMVLRGRQAPLVRAPFLSSLTRLQEVVLDDVQLAPRVDPVMGHRLAFERLILSMVGLDLTRISLRRLGMTSADLDFLVECLTDAHHLDLKSNHITDLSNEALEFFMANVHRLVLSNNPLSLAARTSLVGKMRAHSSLKELYLRSVGFQEGPEYYGLVQALQQRGRFNKIDLRDNPANFGPHLLMLVVGANSHVREMMLGSSGAEARPGIGAQAPMDRPKKGTKLQALRFGGPASDADLRALTGFFGNRSRLNHLTFEGEVDAASLVNFLGVESLKSLTLRYWLGNRDQTLDLVTALWKSPTLTTLDVRGPEIPYTTVLQVMDGLRHAEKSARAAWEVRRAHLKKRFGTEGMRHGRLRVTLQERMLPYRPKLFTVKVRPDYPRDMQGLVVTAAPDFVTLLVEAVTDPLEG